VWRLTDQSSPASLSEHLAARGFIREMDCQMLVTTLPIAGLRVNPAVRVEEVVDRAGMEQVERVQHPDWDAARLAPHLDDRMRALGTDQHLAVAYLDGRPVGSARWLIHRTVGAVEFNGAETLPSYRERGVYSTLAAFRAARAAAAGCKVAGVNADRGTSAPILLKRGFVDLGPVMFFLWPSSHF
jgi:GNAT superfamily N-acetyltransferase